MATPAGRRARPAPPASPCCSTSSASTSARRTCHSSSARRRPGGLYFDARDASGLAAALDSAVEAPVETSGGHLSVRVVADGELADATVRVVRAGSAEEVASGRTYTSPDTNPRLLPLPEGSYDVAVAAVRIAGASRRFEGVAVDTGETAEKVVDFSSGELAIGVTRNGELSDATVSVFAAGTRETVASGRTYRAASSDPRVFRLAAGHYDVEVASVEIAGKPGQLFTGVEVPPRGRAERSQAFASGQLSIGAVRGRELVDATVAVRPAGGGPAVDSGRTYTRAESNPKRFVLSPGSYVVEVKGVQKVGGAQPERQIEVVIEAGGMVERTIDFTTGG